MGVGWNMGNTLEANDQSVSHNPSDDAYWGQQGLESETCWGQAVTKPELIKMMKEAGFGAIRVPVTWYNHIDKDGKVWLSEDDKDMLKTLSEIKPSDAVKLAGR